MTTLDEKPADAPPVSDGRASGPDDAAPISGSGMNCSG